MRLKVFCNRGGTVFHIALFPWKAKLPFLLCPPDARSRGILPHTVRRSGGLHGVGHGCCTFRALPLRGFRKLPSWGIERSVFVKGMKKMDCCLPWRFCNSPFSSYGGVEKNAACGMELGLQAAW